MVSDNHLWQAGDAQLRISQASRRNQQLSEFNSRPYLSTGRHCKKNYNVRYETLKKFGYRSLVNEYYKYKEAIKNKIQ
jgi:hypothetical protein